MRVKKNCEACPFKSRTCGSRGSKLARVAIVGESPGTTEILEGSPFIGPSGELLSRLLDTCGIDEKDCFITNAVSCLPPRSKGADGKLKKDALINDAARACRGRLIAELEAMPNLELIVSMGSIALRSLSQRWSASIIRERGMVFEVHRKVPDQEVIDAANPVEPAKLGVHGVMPTFHPAYILRSPGAYPQIKSDMMRASRYLSGEGFPKPEITWELLEDENAILRVIRAGLKGRKRARVVADIETTGLDRYADKFICIGFQFEHAIAEKKTHVYFVNGRRDGALVRFLFRNMPEWVEWIWHNGKFDTSFLRAKGIPRTQCRVDQDTLLLSYTLDESQSRHSLERCIIDHLGLPNYKDMLAAYVGTGKKKKSYALVPRELLYSYAATDVTYTGLLFKKLFPAVMESTSKPWLKKAYADLLIPASNALASVELRGMPIDQQILQASKIELRSQLEPIKAWLIEASGNPDFNPNSNDHITNYFKDVQKIKLPDATKDTLSKHKRLPFVGKLLEYKGLQKLLSTYIYAFEKYGARVHTSYLLHGTVTGRLSSSGPNMQNIPDKKIVRRHFVAPKKRVFVSFDYAQAELRSLAVLSGDEALLDIFRSGKDMHSAVAAQVYGTAFTSLPKEVMIDGKMAENPVFKEYRRKAKTVNFGVVYGATEFTLMERLGITWDEAHVLVSGWFKMFPKAREFMDKCRAAPRSGRPLTTVFGRQRRFYVITNSNAHGQENEAGNFPHQSMCSDFTLDSAIQIDKIEATRGLPGNAFQINIVHDDNLFECDDDRDAIRQLIALVRPIMEETPVRHGITALTFKSDAKIGRQWTSMVSESEW